jgi:L-alanine-DL-glutamate epimerase-like enolase superfamily enzyme
MKIKVDKKEYEDLLERVESLEEKVRDEHSVIFENWRWTRETLYKMMEDYFKTQCITTIVERDKDKIVGEVRKQAMDNLFKEEK